MPTSAEHLSEVREFRGSLRERPRLVDDWLEFEGRHVIIYRLDKKPRLSPDFHVSIKARSAGGFTLTRTCSSGSRLARSAGPIASRAVRSFPEIARDSRDHFTWTLHNSGNEMEFAQLGRTQRLKSGCYAFNSEEVPMIATANEWSGQLDGISIMMPREFVNQR